MRWRIMSVAVSLLIAVGSSNVPQAHARIVVGVSTVNVAFLPIYLTQDKGFFKDEGMDVLVVMFNAGATNLQALIGGDVQIMAGGVPETVLARASGVDIKNFWAISNMMPFQIYGGPALKSLKDGKGKNLQSAASARFLSFSPVQRCAGPESIPRMLPCCRSAPLRLALPRWPVELSMPRFFGFR